MNNDMIDRNERIAATNQKKPNTMLLCLGCDFEGPAWSDFQSKDVCPQCGGNNTIVEL
jgi:rRNA maturation endonuclease Nob1